MDDQATTTTKGTKLTDIAERATASSDWWKEGALEKPSEFELSTRVLAALDSAGIRTIEELKQAGPRKLRELEGIGKGGFEQIVTLLRALDRQSNGGEPHDQQHGQTTLR